MKPSLPSTIICSAFAILLLGPALRAAETAAPVPTNGNFEEGDLDWVLFTQKEKDHWKVNSEVIDEDGNHFLRMERKDPEQNCVIRRAVEINPEWGVVNVSVRIRGVELDPGVMSKGFDGAVVLLNFLDAAGLAVGGFTVSGSNRYPVVKSPGDWEEFQISTSVIPAGATQLEVSLVIKGGTGIADFDDVSVSGEL
jgi:hypothetical protein